ncbi:hypothetical protein LSUE1_G006755 [Lachnellula suecica]|uniref:Uncharacterized protein n=1 Tax=Lachnellula suecica TaxID=602035 RepID=A0A8T9C3T7_9HELO|nr:hypothetical protein LSUE1_G006755 [Lachnellula suecica]
MGADTSLAVAALAVAFVALTTALGQLLQQYFATADGYRRCQKSVMGKYARRTRLRWRWREFRFETLYTVPEICLSGDMAELVEYQTNYSPNDGNRPPQTKGKKEAKLSGVDHGEMACWVPLLHWIHETTCASLDNLHSDQEYLDIPPSKVRIPALLFRERSWDFQPPDVVRPLAKTTLSDIAVIARRMGMKWKDFRPADGILRAEGHSHTITSTVVRSLGIVLQYSYTGQGKRLLLAQANLQRNVTGTLISEQDEVYIPSAKADRLGCGVLRTETMFGLPDFSLSTQSEIVAALSYLDRTGECSARLTAILTESPDFRFRVADLVALTTPPVRSRGSNLVQVPAPNDNLHGVTTSAIGRRAFRNCLEPYISDNGPVGIATQNALDICLDIGTQFAAWDHTDEYSRHEETWVVTRDTRYMDVMQEYLWSLTLQLHDREQMPYFRYQNLLRTGFVDKTAIVDAWVTMILRALLWGACHFFVPGERVPIQYFGSRLPVYIG